MKSKPNGFIFLSQPKKYYKEKPPEARSGEAGRATKARERILKQSGNKKAIRSDLKGLNALKDLLDPPKCL